MGISPNHYGQRLGDNRRLGVIRVDQDGEIVIV
jgi:hypothetical protein